MTRVNRKRAPAGRLRPGPMDFFASQEQARRRTWWLVCGLTLAVFLTICLVHLTLVWFLGAKNRPSPFWDGRVFLIVTAAVTLLVGCGSLVELVRFRIHGGAGVATALGGRLVQPNTGEPSERVLLNVVEEMALAAGTPPPPVYCMDAEKGINAFAAGCKPSDAVIAVTHGAVTQLERDELQGVIAHEFSHILNGDMRLNINIMGILQGLIVVATIGRAWVQPPANLDDYHRSGKEGGMGMVFLLPGWGLLIAGSIGVLFARLIKAAMSRQREVLADAAAVQFTRNPGGLAGALKKIGGLGYSNRMRSPHAEQVSHLFFAEPWGRHSLLATHPPLVERVRGLDPAFNGVFERRFLSPEHEQRARARAEEELKALAAFEEGRVTRPPAPVSIEDIMASVGRTVGAHVDVVRVLLAALPAGLHEAAHEPSGARAVVYGLLLNAHAEVRTRQWTRLEERADPAVLAETRKLQPEIERLPPESVLALLDLCLPALKTMSREQYLAFKDNAHGLALADGKVDLLEFALLHILRHHLDAHFVRRSTRLAQIYGLRGVQHETSILLSLMAHTGAQAHTGAEASPEARQAAFDAAVAVLKDPRAVFRLLPAEACTLDQVDQALERLGTTSPRLKKAVVSACLACLAHDGRVTSEEFHLFRAVAGALDVPVPPWATA